MKTAERIVGAVGIVSLSLAVLGLAAMPFVPHAPAFAPGDSVHLSAAHPSVVVVADPAPIVHDTTVVTKIVHDSVCPAPVPPPSGSHEPAGLTTLSDYAFPSSIPTSCAGSTIGECPIDASGWRVVYNGAGNVTTSGGVLQVKYPTGYVGGGAPGTVFYNLASHPTTFYTSFGWKVSAPWQSHPSNINKVVFEIVGASGNSGLTMYGPVGGPYRLSFFPEFIGSAWSYVYGATPVTLGTRHVVETLVTPTAFTWWLDGVQQGTWSGTLPAVSQFKISPTWGGLNGTKTETDYFWYDRVHLSGK